MITAIILSKDRASQLHLLLESLQKNSGNLFDIRVIYEATNQLFEDGYKKTKEEFFYKDRYGLNFPIRWFPKKHDNLSLDIIENLSSSRDLTCVFNDENIMFNRPPSYKKIMELFRNNDISSLSLRLGNNTVIQNPYDSQNYFIDKPEDGKFLLDKFMVWDASLVKPFTNFAMPFSHNGHIYTTKLIHYILSRTKINSIESFEKSLQDNLYMGAFSGFIPPEMSCLEYSIVIRNSAKKVSDESSSDFGTSEFGLNDRYLSQSVIDYDFFDFRHISKPYEEFITRFKREDHMHYGR
tara:strand:- start:2241 stop:3125 length:885 start_codon:yes stop_codon:yes gene_type:complete